MLNPSQIRSRHFSSTARGTYRSEEVDAFVEEVAVSYEQMFQENAELVKRLNQLAERVDEYRKDEDSIRSAILTAQKVADQITREAQISAQTKTDEADAYYDELVAKAKAEAHEASDSAQRRANGILSEAEMKAQLTEKEARQQSQDMVESARRESAETLERISNEIKTQTITLEMIKKEAATFKQELVAQYNRHLAFIEELPGVVAGMTQETPKAVSSVAEPFVEETPTDDISEEEPSGGMELPSEQDSAQAQAPTDIFAAMKAKAMSQSSADEAFPEAAEAAVSVAENDAIPDVPTYDAAERETGAQAVVETDIGQEDFGEKPNEYTETETGNFAANEQTDDSVQTAGETLSFIEAESADEQAGEQSPVFGTAFKDDQDAEENDTLSEDEIENEVEEATEDVNEDENEEDIVDDIEDEDEDDDNDEDEADEEYEEDEEDDEGEDIEDEDDEDEENSEEEDDTEDDEIDGDTDEETEDEAGEDVDEGAMGIDENAGIEHRADNDGLPLPEENGEADASGGFRISLDDFDDDGDESESRRTSLSDFETVQFDEEEDEESDSKGDGESPQSRFRGFFKK